MPRYAVYSPKGAYLGEVKDRNLAKAWIKAIETFQVKGLDNHRALRLDVVGRPVDEGQDVDAIIAKVSYNGAVNLMATLEEPGSYHPGQLAGDKRIFTGLGKWTYIAALGVFNGLEALGLVTEEPNGEFDYDRLSSRAYARSTDVITPLGRRVAARLLELRQQNPVGWSSACKENT